MIMELWEDSTRTKEAAGMGEEGGGRDGGSWSRWRGR
jgi:hypothetical protein